MKPSYIIGIIVFILILQHSLYMNYIDSLKSKNEEIQKLLSDSKEVLVEWGEHNEELAKEYEIEDYYNSDIIHSEFQKLSDEIATIIGW